MIGFTKKSIIFALGLANYMNPLFGRVSANIPDILSKEFRISDPIQIALILLDLQLNIEILQVTRVMD